MSITTIILAGLVIFIITAFLKTVMIVPQKSAFIVERLGKYSATLEAGFHILIPFIDRVSYKHTLKEQAIDVPPQTCITRDNIPVEVDGILYLQVMDPKNASYGINNYGFASMQMAQTTMRSVIGKLDLDKTFEERDTINGSIVEAVDKASDPWGVKVMRYEVKNIEPPQTIREAMEKQMRAEREKRALILESEGDRQSKINRSEGEKQEFILRSEGEKQRRINEAEGRAREILLVAEATAAGISEISKSIGQPNGMQAVNLRVAELYLQQFGSLAKTNNTMIVPSNLTDISTMVASALTVMKGTEQGFSAGSAKPSV
jgi:regulator of protease activity HflC (stomatin/prohibitin superfamily)